MSAKAIAGNSDAERTIAVMRRFISSKSFRGSGPSHRTHNICVCSSGADRALRLRRRGVKRAKSSVHFRCTLGAVPARIR